MVKGGTGRSPAPGLKLLVDREIPRKGEGKLPRQRLILMAHTDTGS